MTTPGTSAPRSSRTSPTWPTRSSGWWAGSPGPGPSPSNFADKDSGVSFESYSGAARHLRHYDHLLHTRPADTTLARADATFYAQ
ncbi:AbfB domain-containing protein [Streptomyces mirabilis]|uniref:AbfB domain-containing protein n=1 Tax=Streptomyces mirabilis TaxID=68239 RepID=UPI00332B6CFF